MLSVSQTFAEAGPSRADQFQALGVAIRSAWKWAHYSHIFIVVAWNPRDRCVAPRERISMSEVPSVFRHGAKPALDLIVRAPPRESEWAAPFAGSKKPLVHFPQLAPLARARRFVLSVRRAFAGLGPAPTPRLERCRRPAAAVLEQLSRARSDPALSRLARPAHFDERYGVPSFVWANRALGTTAGAAVRNAEQAARDHLTRLAPWYGLDAEDVRGARLRDIHDTGQGGIIVSLKQDIDGVEVFRDEVKILMDRGLELLAVSGYVPGRAAAGPPVRRRFRLAAPEAIARALADFSQGGTSPGLRPTGRTDGGYEVFAVDGKAGRHDVQPIRAKRCCSIVRRVGPGMVCRGDRGG
jgi:hypothetical protein